MNFSYLISNNLRHPWWSSVKNPPANAGDVGVIPGPEDSHATRQLSLYATATEPDFLEPMFCSKRSHLIKKPKHSNKDSAQPKINK